jgi:hypothetical protein
MDEKDLSTGLEIEDAQEEQFTADSFGGASDSMLRAHRPDHTLDTGDAGQRVMFVLGIVITLSLLGGSALLRRNQPTEQVDTPKTTLAPTINPPPAQVATAEAPVSRPRVEPAPAPSVPDAGAVAADLPAPNLGSTNSVAELPVAQQLAPRLAANPDVPPNATAKVQLRTAHEQGSIDALTLKRRLRDQVDRAVRECWESNAPTSGVSEPFNIVLMMTIKWSGNLSKLSLERGTSELQKCIKSRIPRKGWPEPSDGGDVDVTRAWTLTRE